MDENNAGSFIESMDLVMDTLDTPTGSFLPAEIDTVPHTAGDAGGGATRNTPLPQMLC